MAGSTDGQRAHDILLGYEPLSRHGACWYYVWQAYAAAGAWTNQGSTATAYQGWQATQGKHPGDWNPPAGAAIWLGRRYDGNMDGDVFIAGHWDGEHSATDQPVYGQTGDTAIQARMNLCGREYLGWSDHVLDCPIMLDSEDDMTQEQYDALNAKIDAIYQNTSWIVNGLGVGGANPGVIADNKTIFGRVVNIDQQVTGADDFDQTTGPSVAARVIDIQETLAGFEEDDDEGIEVHHHYGNRRDET